MCGIAGLFGSSLSPDELRKTLEAMNSAQAHRGPDDGAIWIDPKGWGGLAHRRLSIVDLEGGREPIPNEDETIRLIWNGELYNHVELRHGLESKGHVFRSRTDAEVVVHLYEEVGETCLDYLRGMFAFAIWDSRTRTLFFARDRLGKKPLVYRHDGGTFAFASELGALRRAPGFPRRLDIAALHLYMALGYIPAPRTIYHGVCKLPPGYAGRFLDGDLRTWKYWSPGIAPSTLSARLATAGAGRIERPGRKPPLDEATQRVFSLLHESVKLRLMGDVPVGICLSGGIDSAVITGLASLNSPVPLKTFTIGFEEAEYDERAAARRVAEHFGAEHHEEIVRPDAAEALPRLLRHFGEPFADSSALPMDALARMMHPHVKAAIGGDGGDELFAGYLRYEGAKLAAALDWVPGALRGAAARGLRWTGMSKGITRKATRRDRFLNTLDRDPASRYLEWISVFLEDERHAICLPEEPPDGRPRDLIEPYFNPDLSLDAVGRVQAFDLLTYLPGDLLTKIDIAGMANGLEVRAPFLDHPLVDYVTQLPTDYKLNGKMRKFLLREAFQNLLPEGHFDRPKQGFAVPVGQWFREKLKPFLWDHLTDRRARQRGLFRPSVVTTLLEEHAGGEVDHGPRLWSLLCFEVWAREALDG